MGLFPESTGGSLVFPPKVGEKRTVSLIGEIERVKSSNEKFNYKMKNQKDAGYHDLVPVIAEVENEEGTLEQKETKMVLGTWKLYFAIKESGVDVGDTIEIDHVSAGTYNIKKV